MKFILAKQRRLRTVVEAAGKQAAEQMASALGLTAPCAAPPMACSSSKRIAAAAMPAFYGGLFGALRREKCCKYRRMPDHCPNLE